MDFTAHVFKRRILEGLSTAKHSTDPLRVEDGRAVDLSKLLSIAGDAAFVTEAYRLVLGRESDPVGFSNYSALLRDGLSRASVLRQLTQSDEARATGLCYVGLADSNFSSVTAMRPGLGKRTKFWVLERLRRIHAFTLRALRIERMELKLDYATAEMAALADRQSAKIESAFAGISEKLDRYGMELRAQQLRQQSMIAEVVAMQQQFLNESFEPLRQRLHQLESTIEQTARLHTAAIEALAASRRPPVFPAGPDVIATEVDGFILGIPAEEWRLAAYSALRGVPEPGMIKVFREMVKPGMVVVDVGAHIGLYTLYALRGLNGLGKVFAFEPSARTVALLRDNVQVNGFLESGVARILPLAVAAQSGDATLSIIKNNSGHNTLFGKDLPGEVIPTRTTSLDEALMDEPRVDIVKIDAEGSEPLILQGMSKLRSRNPELRIFLEFAPEHLRRAGVDPLQWAYQLLTSGYVVRRLEDVTGELIPVSAEELAGCISWNLLLSPPTAAL